MDAKKLDASENLLLSTHICVWKVKGTKNGEAIFCKLDWEVGRDFILAH